MARTPGRCHLDRLVELSKAGDDAQERLATVLEAYALLSRGAAHRHQAGELSAALHQGPHVARAQDQLHRFFRELILAAQKAGGVRDDVTPDELATYCLNALAAARSLGSAAAVRRLTTVVLAGLRTPS